FSFSLDRLFVLLESCPNETLRVTAARQLGELAQKAPGDVDAILARVRLPFLIIKDQLIRLPVTASVSLGVNGTWDCGFKASA
ncbi:TATA-binding protein-associated factor MOT1, partial [Taenia solium]